MHWQLVRTFLTLGVRGERFSRHAYLSLVMSAVTNVAISLFFYHMAAGITRKGLWDSRAVFLTLAWMFMVSSIHAHSRQSFAPGELDFLNMLPLNRPGLFLAKAAEGLAFNVWNVVGLSGLYFGWAANAEQVNQFAGLVGYILLFLHMSAVGLLVSVLLVPRTTYHTRSLVARMAVGVTLLSTLALFFMGPKLYRVIALLRPLEHWLGIGWYARAAASPDIAGGLVPLLVGALELASLIVLAYFAIRGELEPEARASTSTRLRQQRRAPTKQPSRGPFAALMHKDGLLLIRTWTRLLGGFLVAAVLLGALLLAAVQNGAPLAGDQKLRQTVAILFSVIATMGPGLLLSGRAFAEDYDFLWIFRLTCDLRQYVLGKFLFCTALGALFAIPVSLGVAWLLQVQVLPLLLSNGVAAVVVAAVVVAAAGLLISAARQYAGVDPRARDPFSTLFATGVVYVYLLSVIGVWRAAGLLGMAIVAMPFWLLASAASLGIAARLLAVQDLKY